MITNGTPQRSRKNEWSITDRPLQFKDVKGNNFRRDTLVTSLSKDVFPQIVLFSGQAGVSKTTLALISALSLQCKNTKEGEPCLECDPCKDIIDNLVFNDTTDAEKTAGGVTLWNMAIKSGVQDADELIEILSYEQDSDYAHRVFILEEPQNMSYQCQDRLLLVFENLPFNTHILLCTTDVQRLRPAFASRALHLPLTTPSLDEVVELLTQSAVNHGVPIPKNKIALKVIAQHCNSVPRDSVKLFQLLAETGDVTLDRVIDWIGEIAVGYYIKYYNVVQTDITDILDLVADLEQSNVSYIDFLKGLREFTKDLLLMKYGRSVWKYNKDAKKAMREILEGYTYKEFLIFNNLMADLRYTTESQAQSELLALSFRFSDHLLTIVQDKEKLLTKENRESVKNYTENKRESARKSMEKDSSKRIESIEDILLMMEDENDNNSVPEIVKLNI